MRTHDEEEFENAFDANGMLKDGVTRVRVPIKMMDSAGGLLDTASARDLIASTDDKHSVHDAAIQYVQARLRDRRPGFTRATPASTRNVLYDSFDQAISQQWRAPPTGAGSRGPRGAQAGDVCTIDGWPGHLRSVDGELKCVADKKRAAADQADHHQMMDALYAERDHEVSEQWRRAK